MSEQRGPMPPSSRNATSSLSPQKRRVFPSQPSLSSKVEINEAEVLGSQSMRHESAPGVESIPIPVPIPVLVPTKPYGSPMEQRSSFLRRGISTEKLIEVAQAPGALVSEVTGAKLTADSLLRDVLWYKPLLELPHTLVLALNADMTLLFANEYTLSTLGAQVDADVRQQLSRMPQLQTLIESCLRKGQADTLWLQLAIGPKGEPWSYLVDVYPRISLDDSQGVVLVGRRLDQAPPAASPARNKKLLTIDTTTNDDPQPSQSPRRKAIFSLDYSFQIKMIRTLVHDVKQPFKGILAGLHTLESELKLSPAQVDLIEDLKQSCKDSLLILHNVITFKEHTHDILTPSLQEISVLPLLHDAIHYFHNSIRQLCVTISVHNESNIKDLFVRGDTKGVEIVIRNLLSNAIHFAPYYSDISITVSAKEDILRIECHDNGPGVPKALLNDLFISTELHGEGKLCLGLRCSQLWMQAMEGHIGLLPSRSDDATGSTFFIELPIVNKPMVKVSKFKTKVVRIMKMLRNKQRYLVIDDSGPSRKMMMRLLFKQSAETLEARNGADAVEVIKKSLSGGGVPVDIVLMDAFMPIMDGFQAAYLLRELGFKGIIVGLGVTIADDIKSFISHGADEVLPKPLVLSDLNAILLARL